MGDVTRKPDYRATERAAAKRAHRAHEVDGIATNMDRLRPAVNPWRHIATRQQHFKRAIEAHAFIPFTITGPRPTNRFQAYDAAQAAFAACRWGTT